MQQVAQASGLFSRPEKLDDSGGDTLAFSSGTVRNCGTFLVAGKFGNVAQRTRDAVLFFRLFCPPQKGLVDLLRTPSAGEAIPV